MPGLLNPTDIIGRRFGSLTVSEFIRAVPYSYGKQHQRTRKDYFYRCSCDCGVNVEARRVHLLTEHKKSCGCQWKPTADRNWRWTGHGEISGMLWARIRGHAKIRGLVFGITIQDAWGQFLNQGRKCAYTGTTLKFGSSVKDTRAGGCTASLDRIDNTQGYFKSNIHWVHKDINQMKNDFTVSRFIELCCAVARHEAEK